MIGIDDDDSTVVIKATKENVMKRILCSMLLLMASSIMCFLFATPYEVQWAVQQNASVAQYARHTVTDSFGNIYIVGNYSGTVSFGDYSLTSFGGTNVFLAKMSPNGNWLWAIRAGGDRNIGASGICFAADGNILITGYYNYIAYFGTTTLTATGSNYELFVAKVSVNGEWLWASRTYSGTTFPSMFYSQNIVSDSAGNIYVTGSFKGSNVWPNWLTTGSGASDYDIFVFKLNSSGGWLWGRQAGSNASDQGTDIAIDSNGDLILVGMIDNYTSVFGSITLQYYKGGFVAKISASGNWIWVEPCGRLGDATSIRIKNNTAYILGQFAGTSSWGSFTHTASPSPFYDLYVAKFDLTNRLWQWVSTAVSDHWDYGGNLDLDSQGNLFISGFTESTSISFGSTILSKPEGSQMGFVAMMNPNGNWVWALGTGGNAVSNKIVGLVVDHQDRCIVSGNFVGTVTIGSNTFVDNGMYGRFYIAKLRRPYILIDNTAVLPQGVTISNTESIPSSHPVSVTQNAIVYTVTANGTRDITVMRPSTYSPDLEWNVWLYLNGSLSGSYTSVGESIEILGVVFDSKGSAVVILDQESLDTLPVTLSSFTAVTTLDNYVSLVWVTQTETGLTGYYIYRANQASLSQAAIVSPLILAENSPTQQSYRYTDTDLSLEGTYFYWLYCYKQDGSGEYFGPISIDYNPNATDQSVPGLPVVNGFNRVFPNPFSNSLTVNYSIKETKPTSLMIYNIRGQLIRTFGDLSSQVGGNNVLWDGKDNLGKPCGSGVYLLRLTIGNEDFYKRVVIKK